MASRKEEKERRRQERLAQERLLAQQTRTRRLYGIVAAGVLVVAAVGAGILLLAAGGGGSGGGDGKGDLPPAIDPPAQKVDGLPQAAKAAGCRLSNPPIEGSTHVEDTPKYKTNPPTSGNHNPVPAEDGAYGKAPGITHLVHSMEHGRVEYQFDPTIGRQRIGQLRGLFDQDPYHLILTPNTTKMPYDVAAVAWGHLAGCKRFTNATFDVLRAFRARYQDKGPEFVP